MAFGIDFGTTNSAVVFNKNTCLYTDEGHPFPSVVAVHRTTGDVICGPKAKQRKEDLQDNDYIVISSVKSHLDNPAPLGTVRGKAFTAEDIACELFKGLREHVRQRTARTGGADLTSAAVSIPVGFPPERRRRLRVAAQRAGITITDFLSEPTAAFIHCRGQMPECSRVAVFDWGGGTLDVSILQIQGDEIHELATEGLQEAGDKIDYRIAEWAHSEIMNGQSAAQPFDRIPATERGKLVTACERAKIQLSDEQSRNAVADATATVTLPRYLGKQYVTQPINGATLNRLVAPLIDHAIETLRKALSRASARSGGADIDRVLLIGGSSKLWALRERLLQMFKNRVFRPEQPDWSVAQGASHLAGHPGSYRLMQRICLEMADGSAFNLVNVGDRFDGAWRRHHLGIVEESESAQLVFAEPVNLDPSVIDTSPRLRRIGNISVPMQGFYRERLRLDTRLTEDLTLEAKAQSANADGENRAHWTRWSYPQLRFAYNVEPERGPTQGHARAQA